MQRVDITGETIDEEIDILMVVHPQSLSEQMLYAIDQFVMRGGSTLLFLDPNADSMVSRSPQGNLIPAGMSSELPGLLEAWGIEFDNSKVLADNELALRVMMGQGQRPVPHLGMLGVQRNFLTQGDIITNRLETINFSSTGAIAEAEGSNTDFEPLIVSSADAMLMDRTFIESVTDPSVLFDEFESVEQSFVIAARISGIIESAFPDGRPIAEEESEEATIGVEEGDATTEVEVTEDNSADEVIAVEDDMEIEEEPFPEHIASSNGVVSIVAFADTDVLSDRMWVQVTQFLGQRIPQPFANNGDIVINALENLSGGADLSSIRSRGRYSRPFTRVLDLQRQADDRLREEESELLDSLAATEAELAQLNQDEDGNPIGELTPEIQAEIDRFNAEMVETRRRLRDVRFQLTEDIERLGTNLKAANTALIPILLTIFVLIAHLLRVQRSKTSN